MKKLINTPITLLFSALCILAVSSCQKNGQNPSKTASASTSGYLSSSAFSSNQAIALSSSSGDTIYAVNMCQHGFTADTLAQSALPDSTLSYLAANYSGYTFKVAFRIQNRSKTLQGYVVAIRYNGNPVALRFDAKGIFLNVLEQLEGPDMHGGRGFHPGGCFGDRDGQHPDTVAISALPSIVTSYFTTNHPKDTLKHAFVNRDTSYLVISKDTGVYATVLTSAGKLITRVELYPHVITQTKLTQAQLPASINTYLTTTYPGYVFENAIEVELNGNAKAYLLVIEENTTKYVVGFDANGNFVRARTIR